MPDREKMQAPLHLRSSDRMHGTDLNIQNWLALSPRSMHVRLERLCDGTENLRECLAEMLGGWHCTHGRKFVVHPHEAFLSVEDANRCGRAISGKEVAFSC